MGIFRQLQRFNRDDYRTASAWFLEFLDGLNPMIDELNGILPGNVDLDSNILGERQQVTLSHAVPVTIKLRTLKSIPRFVRLGYAAGHVGLAGISSYNVDGTFQTIVFFSGVAPTAPVSATLYFEP